MSGGVDSSVAAALLIDQGYRVIGAFMKNWSEGGEEGCAEDCGWQRERQDALKVCAQLGIPFMTFDFEKEYRERVVGYMVREYAAGRTPNPDVMCNSVVKFDLFLAAALREGADMIATGHYARVESVAGENSKQPQYFLKAGLDNNKDQTYFLHQLSQEQLSRTLFPIGHLEKPAVREIARAKNLLTAEKKDSQGICFVGKIDLSEFLKKRIAQHPGPIITVDGVQIGEHTGLAPYTIGQRQGINIGGGPSYFVVEKRQDTNTLVVTPSTNEAPLYRSAAQIENMHWISGNEPTEAITCLGRIRYRQPLQELTLTKNVDNTWQATFTVPQRAITPGQFLVIYDGEICLGGGVIM